MNFHVSACHPTVTDFRFLLHFPQLPTKPHTFSYFY
jgi:hypothetical protein